MVVGVGGRRGGLVLRIGKEVGIKGERERGVCMEGDLGY